MRPASSSFQFAPSTYTVTEGSPVTLTVTRTGGSVGPVIVPWQASGFTPGDITPTSGNFSFIAGLTSQTVTIMTAANSVIEGNRSITLTLGAPTGGGTPGAPTTATLNVLDRNNGGVVQFVNAAQTVAENVLGGVVNLALSRTGTNLAGGIQVDYTLTGNTSAVTSALNGSVTFAATATTASIPVTIVNAAGPQLDRQVVVTLSNPRSTNAFTSSSTSACVCGEMASNACDSPLRYMSESFATKRTRPSLVDIP